MNTRQTLRSAFLLSGLLIATAGLSGCGSPVLTPAPKISPTFKVTPSMVAAASTPIPTGSPVLPTPGTFISLVQNIPGRQFDSNLPEPGYAIAQLRDGRVLIAGGTGADNLALATAQLYWPGATSDPLDGVGVNTGQMNEARTDFSLTTLSGGLALAAGGSKSTNGEPLASAEVYDAGLRAFTSTGSMKFARENLLTLALPDGRAVVLGGDQGCWRNECKILTSAEIYDPASGLFMLLTNKLTARTNQTATLLADGQILIAGGDDAVGKPLASAELLNPITGSVTLTGPLTAPRDSAAAVLLTNGQVLVAGGFNYTDSSTVGKSAELYNPATGKFTLTSPMLAPTVMTVALVLPNKQVLLAGSPMATSTGSSDVVRLRAELYDPASATFRATGDLPDAFGPNQGCLLADGTVFIYGHDYGANGNFDGIAIYNP
jgi:hypothetical protein